MNLVQMMRNGEVTEDAIFFEDMVRGMESATHIHNLADEKHRPAHIFEMFSTGS